MSVPKKVAITFDKPELDKVIQEYYEDETEARQRDFSIDEAAKEIYDKKGKSPSHLGDQFVSAKKEGDPAGVRSIIRTGGTHQIDE